jgi:hypothetical protein
MLLRHHARRLRNRIIFTIFKLRNNGKEKFECPICGYSGPFMDVAPSTGLRKHAKCPNCDALERHRIQFIVVNEVLSHMNTTKLKMLHFAPEPFFQEYFSKQFDRYESADISMIRCRS